MINNSVEAFENKSGVIEIKFVEECQKNKVIIKDNGKGMSKEIVTKFMKNKQVDSTKEGGHGIGMQQVRDTLRQMNAYMSIDSIEGIGTEITLTFPKSDYPSWFTDKIALHKGDTVVILDDDPSIHSVWENRLKEYLGYITIKCFTQGSDAIDFINSSNEKDTIFLLTDYELRNQDLNGVDVVEKCEIQKRSIVVTSVYVYRINDFLEKFKITKLLPKAYIDRISITIEENRKNKDVNIVFIDNDEFFVNALPIFWEENGLTADMYTNLLDFLDNLNKYSKDTKIITDYELADGMNGLVLANQLHEKGYTKLYLLSGKQFKENEIPSYLTVIFKGDADFLEKLL
ncbi:hypothetical protein FACS189449_11050 [Alphaproteobacteria bacterium]|nr:hypothetical protein FACS189449_11050 [Alphaproteobacteria bacterium]